MSKSIIRLLIVDDSADDAESLSNALRQAGYMLKTQRIGDISALEAALGKETWDAVVCKSGLPQIRITDVQQAIGKHHAACALFLVSKKFSAEEIRQSAVSGVRDVFLQGDWIRLGPAIEREIETAKVQQAYAQTSETLRQLENRYRVMIENSQEAVAYCHEGVYVDANPAYLSLVGCANVDDLRTIPVLNLIDKNDQVRFKNWLRKPSSNEGSQEFLALASDGRSFAAEIAMSPINLGGEQCIQIFVRDISKRKSLEVKLQYLHQRDALTGIFNRAYFLQELTRAIEIVKKSGVGTQLVGIEVLGLKDLNQRIGHAACDRMLMSITRHLREHPDNNQLLARIGGGRFSMLLSGKSEQENMRTIGEIKTKVAKAHFKDNGNDIPLNVAVNHIPVDGSISDLEKLLKSIFNADAQPATSARAGKEVVRDDSFHAPETRDPAILAAKDTSGITGPGTGTASGQADFSSQITAALENNGMELLFQPIVNLHGEPRELFEVLPVIQLGDGEMLGANLYLPSAVSSGQASKIDRWIMQKSIDHLTQQQKNSQATSLFVSLSDCALSDKILLQAVRQHIKTARMDAGKLYVQLSAAAVIGQNTAARNFIAEARQIGLNVVIDRMDLQRIDSENLTGIDIAYIAIDCHNGSGSAESTINDGILRGAVALAKKLGAMTIARRVENAEIFSLLWGAGVDYIQGDYLSPALSSPDHHFSEEQTLSSDAALPAFNLRVAG